MKLNIKKVQVINPATKTMGYATRVVTNGTATFADLCEEAASNTTYHKKEMEATVGIFLDAVAKHLKNGEIIDMDVLGKLYPTVSGKWTATAEEQTKDLLTPGVNYKPSSEIDAAIKGATLSWTTAADETADTEDTTGTTTTTPSQDDEG